MNELNMDALNEATWEYVDQISKHGEKMSANHWNNAKSILAPVIAKYIRLSRREQPTTATTLPKILHCKRCGYETANKTTVWCICCDRELTPR